jgi:adenylosuccinate synthase
MGIGEAMAASIEHPQLTIRVGDLRDKRRLTELLHAQQLFFARCSETIMPYDKQIRVMSDSAILHYPDSLSEVASVMCEVGKEVRIVPSTHLSRLAQQGSLLFEGAQGVLLDEWRGFHPHTTWSTTTPENARTLLAEIGYTHPTKTLGVMRAYHTRHGAGPFPTEAAGLAKYFHDKNNGTHEWQGAFRVGHLDMVLLRYALTVSGGVDGLVLTHLDQYQRIAENSRQHVCVAYELEGGKRVYNLPINPHLTDLVWQERLTENVSGARPVYDTLGVGASLVEYLERQLGTPVVIGSYGPSAGDKTLLRPF